MMKATRNQNGFSFNSQFNFIYLHLTDIVRKNIVKLILLSLFSLVLFTLLDQPCRNKGMF